jgi:hypothetical protein
MEQRREEEKQRPSAEGRFTLALDGDQHLPPGRGLQAHAELWLYSRRLLIARQESGEELF